MKNDFQILDETRQTSERSRVPMTTVEPFYRVEPYVRDRIG
jgi:hypothetical protein